MDCDQLERICRKGMKMDLKWMLNDQAMGTQLPSSSLPSGDIIAHNFPLDKEQEFSLLADVLGDQQYQSNVPGDWSSQGTGSTAEFGGPYRQNDGASETGSVSTASTGRSSRRGRKRMRRCYTEAEKLMIVRADQEGGRAKRQAVAASIGMAKSTADHLLTHYRKKGKNALKDKRVSTKKKENGVDEEDEDITELVCRNLFLNKNLSFDELRDIANLESFRRILKEFDLCASTEEAEPHYPISQERINGLFQMPQVQAAYVKAKVDDASTIQSWLNQVVVSKKHELVDQARVDMHEASRLAFAHDVLKALEDTRSFCVFLDCIPLSFQTESAVAQIAVHPGTGLIDYKCRKTENFEEFFTQVLTNLLKDKISLFGKNVYFISSNSNEVTYSCVEYQRLVNHLANQGTSVSFLEMAPMSPTLNLGEYFNHTIRKAVNQQLQQSQRKFLEEGKTNESNKSNVGVDFPCFLAIVEKSLSKLKEENSENDDTEKVLRLADSIRGVIATNGKFHLWKAMKNICFD